ncbi:hypothetical protein ACLOJK_028767 [Asimina triloba]
MDMEVNSITGREKSSAAPSPEQLMFTREVVAELEREDDPDLDYVALSEGYVNNCHPSWCSFCCRDQCSFLLQRLVASSGRAISICLIKDRVALSLKIDQRQIHVNSSLRGMIEPIKGCSNLPQKIAVQPVSIAKMKLGHNLTKKEKHIQKKKTPTFGFTVVSKVKTISSAAAQVLRTIE